MKRMKWLFHKTYPIISILTINVTQAFDNADNIMHIFVFLIQILIGYFTIQKIYWDIKKSKRPDVTLEEVEDEVKKDHPFLTMLIQFFTKFRRNKDA
jgi:hypothetical protein